MARGLRLSYAENPVVKVVERQLKLGLITISGLWIAYL